MTDHPWLTHYDPGVAPHLEYPVIPVYAFLDEASRLCPDRACIIFGDQTFSYRQVAAQTDRLAAALIAMGVHPGERIGIFMPNCPEFVLAYFAILKAGAVVVATNPLYTPPEIVHQVNDSDINTIFCAGPLYDRLKSAQPGTNISLVIVAGDTSPQSPDIQFKTLLAKSSDSPSLSEISDFHRDFGASKTSPIALFQYTGGTTGIAKAAVASHSNLVANTLQFKSWMSTLRDEQETFLLALPIYHIYDMVCGMLLGLAFRATLVLIPDPRDITSLISAIQEHHVTYFPAAPTLYNAINNSPEIASGMVDLTSIKACLSGSAPLMQPTKEKFERLTGGRIIEGFGLSEAPTATHCNPLQGENRFGSVGLPIPDVDARIVDIDTGTRELPVGESGELVIHGPQVMQRYHNMPEETALALRDGWLFTGDIARMDSDGYFYIVDRKKDVIKPGGMEVLPREVEEALIEHPGVAEVAVVGIPDDYRGETVKAWLVLKSDQAVSEEELRDWCRSRLAPFKIPTHYEFVASLPKSAMGKILKRELRQK